MSAADDEAGARGAAWLDAQISQRGLSLRRIESDSGVAYRTLQKVLAGEPLKRRDRRAALARALGFRGDAFDLVERGEHPVTLVQEQQAQAAPGGQIKLSASGVDLDELLAKDPEAYAAIMEQARIALDRARDRSR